MVRPTNTRLLLGTERMDELLAAPRDEYERIAAANQWLLAALDHAADADQPR